MLENKIMGEPIVNSTLGMKESDAIELLLKENKILRVINRDGKSLMVSADTKPNRVNVWVKDGVISRLENMG